MSVTKYNGWRQIGQLDEVIFHAVLRHNQRSNCIEIYQDTAAALEANVKDFYYEFNLDSNQCSKLLLTDDHKATEMNDKNMTISSLQNNVKFGRDGTMYFKMDSTYYSMKMPAMITNFSYSVVSNEGTLRYIIIFGGMTNNDNADISVFWDEWDPVPVADIMVFDFDNLQWYTSGVQLPMELGCTSCIMITEATPACVVLNWLRECQQFAIQELVDLIIAYSSRSLVYLCGGIDAQDTGNDKMYFIDVADILEMKGQGVAASMTAIHALIFEAIPGHEIWKNCLKCYVCDEPPRNCLVLPCKHIVCNEECFQEGYMDTLQRAPALSMPCVVCSTQVTGGYRIM